MKKLRWNRHNTPDARIRKKRGRWNRAMRRALKRTKFRPPRTDESGGKTYRIYITPGLWTMLTGEST